MKHGAVVPLTESVTVHGALVDAAVVVVVVPVPSVFAFAVQAAPATTASAPIQRAIFIVPSSGKSGAVHIPRRGAAAGPHGAASRRRGDRPGCRAGRAVRSSPAASAGTGVRPSPWRR